MEGDFLHYYNISHPLLLIWTRFRRLLFALPPESNFFRLLNHKSESIQKERNEEAGSPNKFAKDELRRQMGLPPRNATSTMSLDDLSNNL